MERQLDKRPGALRDKASDLLAKGKRLLAQKQRDKNKLYSLHAPEAECIAKAKTRQPYEFGVKVSIATTHKEGLRRDIRRRSAIEPAIGHMKNDGRLRRNWLKGADGDAFNALLCGCGHNLRMILRKLRLFFAFIAAWLASPQLPSGACTAPPRLFHDFIGSDRPQPSLCLE